MARNCATFLLEPSKLDKIVRFYINRGERSVQRHLRRRLSANYRGAWIERARADRNMMQKEVVLLVLQQSSEANSIQPHRCLFKFIALSQRLLMVTISVLSLVYEAFPKGK